MCPPLDPVLATQRVPSPRTRWRARLPSAMRREAMLWRLLPLSPASYFILGATDGVPFRFASERRGIGESGFQLDDLTITATPAGQSRVSWAAN